MSEQTAAYLKQLVRTAATLNFLEMVSGVLLILIVLLPLVELHVGSGFAASG